MLGSAAAVKLQQPSPVGTTRFLLRGVERRRRSLTPSEAGLHSLRFTALHKEPVEGLGSMKPSSSVGDPDVAETRSHELDCLTKSFGCRVARHHRVAFGSYCADLEAHYRPLRGITGTLLNTSRVRRERE